MQDEFIFCLVQRYIPTHTCTHTDTRTHTHIPSFHTLFSLHLLYIFFLLISFLSFHLHFYPLYSHSLCSDTNLPLSLSLSFPISHPRLYRPLSPSLSFRSLSIPRRSHSLCSFISLPISSTFFVLSHITNFITFPFNLRPCFQSPPLSFFMPLPFFAVMGGAQGQKKNTKKNK